MLDTSGGPFPGGTGRRAAEALAAAIAREVPVTLAGGLDPANVAQALRRIPALGVDVAGGVERRSRDGSIARDLRDGRPRKDDVKVGLFVKRAKAARLDRPQSDARPTPVHRGLLDVDARGRWGVEGEFGGRYVPETLVGALIALEAAWDAVRDDPRFWAELRELRTRYVGGPSALYRADRLAAALERGAGRSAGRLRLYLKREDLNHTGAHKITNALGQALLTRRLGKTRVIAETGAGQHGVATATACALLDLPCVVYMGAEDVRRQAPNVLRMHALGAEVRSVTSGSATLKDAINDAMRDWVTNVQTTHYVLGSAVGPHPYPRMVRDLQRVIGDDAAAQLRWVEGRLPDLAVACVGGGSNAIGLLSRFIGEPDVRLVGVEAAGEGVATGHHAAALAGGSPGVLHGSRSYLLQDRDGQVIEAHSISAGLDYPGIGPQLSALYAAGRLEDHRRHRYPGRGRPAPGDADRGHHPGPRARPRGGGAGPAARRAARPRAGSGRGGRPPRPLRARRQGPRRARGRGVSVAPAAPGEGLSGTGRTVGAARIEATFDGAAVGGRTALIAYIVAGYPDAEASLAAAVAAIDAGADVLELGLPYSDPLADGATLQHASSVALRNGATFERSLDLLARIHLSSSPGPAGAHGLRQPGGRSGRPGGRAATPRGGRRERPDPGRPDHRRGVRDRGRRSRRRFSPSSTSSPPPPPPNDERPSPPGAAATSTRSPSSASPAPGDPCPRGSAPSCATCAPAARSRSRRASVSHDPPTCASSAASSTASSSAAPSWTPSATGATRGGWRTWCEAWRRQHGRPQ